MGYTKRQFVEGAGEEIGMASYVFDIPPETLDAWLRRLDAMMAEWNGQGIRLGYPIPNNPDDSELDQETVVPNWANTAIITNLAIRIAPGEGKAVTAETKSIAFKSFNIVASRSATVPQMQLPGTMPLGSGNRWYPVGTNFVTPPQNTNVPLPEDDVTFAN